MVTPAISGVAASAALRMPDSEALEKLRDNILDARRKADLITTLRVFLQANGNHRLAAERLNLHHNTVRYRIDKIRKLTGCDVTARNLRLQYELALVLLPVIGKAP